MTDHPTHADVSKAERSSALPWIDKAANGELIVTISLQVYPIAAVFRACYWATERCYLFLESGNRLRELRIHFGKKHDEVDLGVGAAEYGNELIDQSLRVQISSETREIRELIVAQAFTEADLGDNRSADYHDDPEHIGK